MHKDKTHLELKDIFTPLPLPSPELHLQFSVTFLLSLESQIFLLSMKKFTLVRTLHNSNEAGEEGKYVVNVYYRTMLRSLHKLFHLILISPLNEYWLSSLPKAILIPLTYQQLCVQTPPAFLLFLTYTCT